MNLTIKKSEYDEKTFHDIVIKIQRDILTDDDVERSTLLYSIILASLIKLKGIDYNNINTLADGIIKELGLNDNLKEYVSIVFSLLEALQLSFETMYIKTNSKGKISIRID